LRHLELHGFTSLIGATSSEVDLRERTRRGMTGTHPPTTTGSLSGISVQRTSLEDAAAAFVQGLACGAPAQAHRLVNSYTFALADAEPAYKSLLAQSGVNLPDGKPLVAALNRLDPRGQPFGQVRGPSFFVKCLEEGRVYGVRHFFLGGSAELLESLKAAVDRRFPGTEIVGMNSPPFRPLRDTERAEQDAAIKASGAQVVWVGLGTPKQDVEAQRICDTLGVTTAAVGAAFDFVAGTKPEAPEWMRRLTIEWLFRLMSEPRRLWRRYLFGNTRFLMLVLREARRRR
jgi:N-acetylglucosaminyldiphosphoundecaprenol N-acetyl-beta-D-mannosaminyltransferase